MGNPASQGALVLVDMWETLRAGVLERAPRLGAELSERAARDWKAMLPRDRATLALLCLLDLGAATPATLRHCRVQLRGMEESGLLDPGNTAGVVAEDGLPEVGGFPPEQREQIGADLRYVMSDQFPLMLGKAAGPVEALRQMNKICRRLRSQRAARFLGLLGYPMVVPDTARLRWLRRFGLLELKGAGRQGQEECLRALDRVAHEAGVSLLEVDLITAAFTGQETNAAEAAFCGTKPRCTHCFLQGGCRFAQFQELNGGVREGSTPPRPTLMEALLPEDRPREKLAQRGPQALTDAELLAIILRTGSGEEHAVEMANRLIRDAGSLDALARASVAELQRFKGLGGVKAVTIKASLELARRLLLERQSREEPQMNNARAVFNHLRNRFYDRRKEQFICLHLNTRNRLIREITISEGTLTQSLVHPREAFQEAVRDSAASVIFAHNHPSGDAQPSREDRVITARLVKAGEVMGIKVLDHVIIGADSFYSFADEGELNG